MQQGQAALGRKDYAVAGQLADEALRLKPGDEAAAGLKAKAAAGAELQKATDLFVAGDYDKALAICAAHPGDEAFAWLPKAIQEKQAAAVKPDTGKLDAELQTLLVLFRVLSPRDAYITSPQAREARPLVGAIGPQGMDYYLAWADRLEAGFRQGQCLGQENREKYLKELKAAIRLAP
jgi:hypothetical protein